MTIWQQIEAIPALSMAEEKELFEDIQEGDDNAVQKLVKHNLRCVIPIAKAMARHDGKWSAGDLLGEATAALMGAATRWDGTGRFYGYAQMRVRGAMKDFLRKKADVVKGMGEQALSLDAPDSETGTTMLDRMEEEIADDAEPEAASMCGLSAAQKAIIQRRILAETPEAIEAIAKDLQVSVGYVKRTMAKYLARLARAKAA